MATIAMNLKLDQLAHLRAWTPLRLVTESASAVDDGLFHVADGIFLIAQPYNRRLIRDEQGPFVTMALWAPSAGAAKRAALGKLEEDDGASGEAPHWMSVGQQANTYRAIVECARRADLDRFGERAIYRVVPDGAFLHWVVALDNRSFLFRNLEPSADEAPYAVRLDLHD